MYIQIRTLTGLVIPLHVDENMTVLRLKKIIKTHTKISPEMQTLLLDGSVLKDDKTLADQKVKSYSIIFLGNKECIKVL